MRDKGSEGFDVVRRKRKCSLGFRHFRLIYWVFVILYNKNFIVKHRKKNYCHNINIIFLILQPARRHLTPAAGRGGGQRNTGVAGGFRMWVAGVEKMWSCGVGGWT